MNSRQCENCNNYIVSSLIATVGTCNTKNEEKNSDDYCTEYFTLRTGKDD